MAINRRNFIKSTGALSMAPLFFNQFKSLMLEADFTMKILRNDIGYFTKRGGTIGFMLSEQGSVVVDTQFPESAQILIDEMKKKSTKPIDLLINTHHHGDHTEGNIAFKDMVNASIAHENSIANQKKSAEARGSEDKQFYPGNSFSTDWATMVGKELISLNYYGAAHTNGDIVVHFENSDVIHMGDLVFNRRFPYIDKNNGANIANWIQVLDTCVGKYADSSIFIFGHCADGYEITGTKEDLKAFGNYLESLMNYMEIQVKAGKSKEEIIEATSIIPGAEEWTGKGIQRSIDAAWQEMGG
jgi:glyoxylase-like metal-dependent hydrolase (beta-lactamase superfamily II)